MTFILRSVESVARKNTMKPEEKPEELAQDQRPRKGAWSPGSHLCSCRKCFRDFIGGLRATWCADCAYSEMPVERAETPVEQRQIAPEGGDSAQGLEAARSENCMSREDMAEHIKAINAELRKMRGIIARNALQRLRDDDSPEMFVTHQDIKDSLEIMHAWQAENSKK